MGAASFMDEKEFLQKQRYAREQGGERGADPAGEGPPEPRVIIAIQWQVQCTLRHVFLETRDTPSLAINMRALLLLAVVDDAIGLIIIAVAIDQWIRKVSA